MLVVWIRSVLIVEHPAKTLALDDSRKSLRQLLNPTLTSMRISVAANLKVWRGATDSNPNMPSGYHTDSQTGYNTLNLMSQSAAAQELLRDLVCTCAAMTDLLTY